jgi:hypothetical protein
MVAARTAAKISFGFINFNFRFYFVSPFVHGKNFGTIHGHKISVEQKGMIEARRLKAHHGRSSRMNQRSRAQFRAKRGALDAAERGAAVETMKFAGFAGKVQSKMLGARSESWIWLPLGAGAGCESDAGFAAQQGMAPCWQQARTCWAQADGTGACAANSGAPASRKLHRMASANFMV